jgi:hypothetical protein
MNASIIRLSPWRRGEDQGEGFAVAMEQFHRNYPSPSPKPTPCLAPKARHAIPAWGNAPGFVNAQTSALKARLTGSCDGQADESRLQRSYMMGPVYFLWRCPRLEMNSAFGAKHIPVRAAAQASLLSNAAMPERRGRTKSRRGAIVSWRPWVTSPFVRERGRVRDNLRLTDALGTHLSRPAFAWLRRGRQSSPPPGIRTQFCVFTKIA